jgi:hypothetical protein
VILSTETITTLDKQELDNESRPWLFEGIEIRPIHEFATRQRIGKQTWDLGLKVKRKFIRVLKREN